MLYCRYHLLFSLTGGGKYNFMGTKRWIEENLDHAGEFFLYLYVPQAKKKVPQLTLLSMKWCEMFKNNNICIY